MPATPISGHTPGLAPSMNPREPAKMASHPHQPASHRARTTSKPPRAREDGLPRTPTSKSPGSHHPKTPASPRRGLLTHTNQQVHGLAPSSNPREPAKTASHAHQPAGSRARTTPKPPRARKDGLPRTPTSRFPGSHYPQTPASPQKRPLTHTKQQIPGLALPQNPREPAKMASDRRPSMNE